MTPAPSGILYAWHQPLSMVCCCFCLFAVAYTKSEFVSNPFSLYAKKDGERRKAFPIFFWRSGRDSNPREIALKLISSQPRYDRFDTAAYLLNSRRSVDLLFYSSFSAVMRGPVMSCCGARNFLLVFRLRKISTAATPFCSLYPPPAALANVPASIPLHISACLS